ncbi:MAG: hypothetical protein ACE37K_22355 [Planctomycetota bacterium]
MSPSAHYTCLPFVACLLIACATTSSPREPAADLDGAPVAAGTNAPAVAPTVAPTVAPVGPAPTNHDCWWFELEADELVAVWLSPRLEGHVPGGFRFVNVIYHDPRAKLPILLRSTPVLCDTDDAVVKSSGVFPSRIAPLDGRTWGQVERRDQLQVRRGE